MSEHEAGYQSLLVEVKAASARALMQQEPKVDGLRFRWEEVFPEGPISIDDGLRTGGTTWLKAVPETPNEVEHPWDWAHAMARSDFLNSPAGIQVVAIEPGTIRNPLAEAPGGGGSGGSPTGGCTPNGQDGYWAKGDGFAWHLGDRYTQLASARARVSVGPGERRVRVAVLDTGYDPTHQTVPVHMRRDLGWNYWRNNDDTTDRPNSGIITHYGHGTGVISVLAGKALPGGIALGGAPDAEVVPLVPAPSIIITDLNLADWAKAFQGAILRQCDVICMSAGGVTLASDIVARAVNEAVDRTGIAVFAAVGNNFVRLPTHLVVMPASFSNVIGVTGACADYSNYWSNWPDRASANWGPDSVMHHVLATFTPNIARARIECPGTIDHDGWGTSQCAPQAAAAAALWLQMHGKKVAGNRAHAVYRALIATANGSHGNFSGWGKGFIRANDALNYGPALASAGPAFEPASISLPGFRGLPALEGSSPLVQRMLEVEAVQLLEGAGELREDLERAYAADSSEVAVQRTADLLQELGRCSTAFRQMAVPA